MTEIIIGKTSALGVDDMPGEGMQGYQVQDRTTVKTAEDADIQYQAEKEGVVKEVKIE